MLIGRKKVLDLGADPKVYNLNCGERRMSALLKIGELASAAGVSRDTIRHYEQLNLLPCARRTRTGYRLYTEADIERLRFIKQVQELGLSLGEIRELLLENESGIAECQHVRYLLGSKLKDLDAHLAQMQSLRATLAAHLEKCEKALADQYADCCPVLSEISHTIK